MSKWIWAAASVVFLVVIIGRLAQIERLLRVASQGIWYLLLVWPGPQRRSQYDG